MNRLCLVKPWRLRTIQQRLDATYQIETGQVETPPCCGPLGEIVIVNCGRMDEGGRFSSLNYRQISGSNHAPVSDVIFASVTNSIPR